MAIKSLSQRDLNSNKIVNLAAPTNDQDASTKKYVDDGLAGKQDSGSYATLTGAETLTNKRVQPRVSSTASDSSVSPTKASYDRYIFTALAANLTINNPTMEIGEVLVLQITDNSTERELDWDTQYVGIDGQPLADSTVDDKTMEFILSKVGASKVLVSYVVEG